MLEKAVTWIIVLIVVVFDPLAVIMLLAAQMTFGWKKDEDDFLLHNTVPHTETPIKVEEQPTTEEIEQTHTEEVPSETPLTALGGDITAPEEKPAEVVGDIPLEQWNKMIEEAEKAVEQEREIEDSDIINSAPETEKQAMTAWKHDNPESSLKIQRRLLDKGIIDHLPWQDYIKPQADFVDDAAVEAKKWADENPDTEESEKAKEWAKEQSTDADLSWMEKDTQGNQVKKVKEIYQQNAEQNEKTLWQRIQGVKK